MAYGSESYKNLANGAGRAFYHLVDAIVQFGNVTADEAVLVASFYKKNKLVKFDSIHGTSHVKHGAYLNSEVILRALAMVK